MASFAEQVAEAILNDAQSGSAVWDELMGYGAELRKVSDAKYTVTIPQGYDENDEPTYRVCVITVEVSD